MNFFKRKKKQESKTEFDQSNFEYMVGARAHGLMALWAAERMGKSSEGAANYADEIVEATMNDIALLTKLREDLDFQEQHVEQEDLEERLQGFKVVSRLETEDEMKNGGGC